MKQAIMRFSEANLRSVWLAIAYLITIHISVVWLLFGHQIFDHPASISPSFETNAHYGRMLTYHGTIDALARDGSVVFIGDSITQGLNTEAVADHSINYGIGSDDTAGVLHRLPVYRSLSRASTVVLSIGVNDLYVRSPDQVAANYRQILEAIPAGPHILISAVLPVRESARQAWKGWGGKIEALNADLRGLASSCQRCAFVDSAAAVRGEEGLEDRFDSGDGIHLNADGYRAWVAKLKAAM